MPDPQDSPTSTNIIVVMGVAGAGKTAVGRQLAQSLGWTFLDADDLHSPEDVARMRQGVPITDATRAPWLDRIRAHLEANAAGGHSTVLACSALKESYRTRLWRDRATIRFVYLKGDASLFRRRLQERSHHFMKAGMLESQLTALEEPRDAIMVDASLPVDEIVQRIRDDVKQQI